MGLRLAASAIATASLLTALTAAGCGSVEDGEPGTHPSFVLITIDTLRADRLGSYGHAAARTPVLDALARRGVLFETATTPFPRTTPALASMMSGVLPWRHGSREVGQPMSATLVTVPKLLDARGYTTLAVTANGAAGRAQNLHLGFDRFLDYQSFPDHSATGVTDATLALFDEAPAPAPFFLWVHYIDPHFPYSPPASWRDQPPAKACRDLVAETAADVVATAHVRMDLGGQASAALADCESLYDAEIAFTDFEIGRLLDALEARGLLRLAYVAVTSDHGENLGEDGLFYEHGPSVNDASLRVPLLVAGPAIPPRVDRSLARLEDLAPTLLALANVPASEWPPFDGQDLSARLRRREAEAEAPSVAVAESGGALLPETFTYLASGRPGGRQCINGRRFSLCVDPGGEPRLYDHVADPFLKHDVSAEHPDARAALLAARTRWPPGSARERTLRTGRYKLIERPGFDGGWQTVLFDLEVDPGERRDLAVEQPEVVERLRAELDAAFAEVGPASAPELEPAQLEALRALGYVR